MGCFIFIVHYFLDHPNVSSSVVLYLRYLDKYHELSTNVLILVLKRSCCIAVTRYCEVSQDDDTCDDTVQFESLFC